MTESIEITLLNNTVSELQIRGQVRSCLDELVTDVQIAHHLRETVTQHLASHRDQQRIKQQEEALLESSLLREKEHDQRQKLADALVTEIWSVSKALGSWQSLQEEHRELQTKHDETLAKLAQAQEDLITMRERKSIEEPLIDNKETEDDTKSTESDKESKAITGPFTENEAKREAIAILQPNLKDGEAVENRETNPVVALDEQEPNETPSFTELDSEIIMHIFGYLDALDILNTAQLNVSMYSRVDTLFGLGPQDAQSSASSTMSLPAPKQMAPPSKTEPRTVSAPSTPPRIDTIRSTKSADEPRGLFSSILQPRRSPQSFSPSRAGESQPMNAAMANSMAAKLSDAELNAIILMTERLKQKETLAAKLTSQNEELQARLDGTEAVKQFLIQKVREMENSLTKSEEIETKVAQQIASDQEVIAFLDSRVQECEREIRLLQQDRDKAQEDLKRFREHAEQKATVMGDMLQFERQKLAESEREWKATKKLLIKEVKSCRAQILSLKAEREGYREQSDLLRKSVLSHPGIAHDRALS